MVKIGRQKNRPNTLVSAASVRWRTLAEKVYCATKNLVLLPYLAPGSKSLLPQKHEFLGLYCSNQLC